jgi:hypothetical protein
MAATSHDSLYSLYIIDQTMVFSVTALSLTIFLNQSTVCVAHQV